jgi:serine/threonine-protein kinase
VADQRWAEVKRLVADAFELPARERHAFLDDACADAELRARAGELLRGCEQAAEAEAFLRAPAADFAAGMIEEVERGPSDQAVSSRGVPRELQAALAGRYTVEREIGHGGMATVYLARDERHQRPVALKVVRPNLTAALEPTRVAARLQREIEIAARLNHPHILPLHDSGLDSGHLYYIMPFVDGETLRARLARVGRLEIDDAVRLLRDIAGALAYAHRQNVVHRDIKPENILLNRDGDALLADFGVAKAFAGAAGDHPIKDAETLTATGLVLGTPAYMAPEQASADPTTDDRADLYALGAVAYEALTGSPPFSRRAVHELIAAHLTEIPNSVAAVRADVPAGLSDLVMKLLAKNPDARPRDAAEVVRILESDAVRVDSSASRRTTREHGRTWLRPALGACALVILAVAILLSRSARRTTPETAGPSIAVLPFANTSGRADDEPFADGLTDELIAAVSRVPTVRVTARTSSFALKGKNLGIRTIADTLHVANVLEGSVRRDGERLKVSTQLVDAATGRILWSATFDRNVRDVFAVQEQIGREVAAALSVRLSGNDAPTQLVRRPTEDFDAYELYLKGRYHVASRRREDLYRAIQYFTEATQRDPSFARAYAGLADAYAGLGLFGYERPRDVFPKARVAVQRALALDPKLGEAHGSLGHQLFIYDWNWSAAEGSLQTAIALDPKVPWVHTYYAALLNSHRRWDEALQQLRIARDLDPLARSSGMTGRVYVSSRRPDEAIRDLLEALEINPQSDLALQVLGHAYLQKRMYDESIVAFRRAAALSGARDSAHLAYAYAIAGRRDEATRIVQMLVGSERERYVPPFHIALAYAGLGEKDEAFRWLERAYSDRASFMDGLNVTPGFDILRSDPRFSSLLHRMHF